MKTVLLVSPAHKELEAVCGLLSDRFDVDMAGDLSSYAGRLGKNNYDLIFMDASLIREILSLFQDQRADNPIPVSEGISGTIPTLAEARKTAIEVVERTYLERVLARHAGKINRTSEASGISCRQLHKLMTKYGIQKEQFKSSFLRGRVGTLSSDRN